MYRFKKLASHDIRASERAPLGKKIGFLDPKEPFFDLPSCAHRPVNGRHDGSTRYELGRDSKMKVASYTKRTKFNREKILCHVGFISKVTFTLWLSRTLRQATEPFLILFDTDFCKGAYSI